LRIENERGWRGVGRGGKREREVPVLSTKESCALRQQNEEGISKKKWREEWGGRLGRVNERDGRREGKGKGNAK